MFILFSCILNLALFLLPGLSLVLSTSLWRCRALPNLVITVVLTGGMLGYVSFWSYFLNRHFGDAFTFIVYAAALFLFAKSLYQKPEARRRIGQLAVPFLLTLFAAMGYLALLNILNAGHDFTAWFPEHRFFEQSRPGDNLIPEIFADKLYTQAPLRPFCCGDWLSSDRPPLQTGIFLLLHPFYKWIGHRAFQYQTLGTVLQCFWISGVWCLLVSLGTTPARVLQTIMFLILSGFLFYNSVYVWPKLLASAYVLFAISIIIRVLRSQTVITVPETMLASGSLSMAMLAHPGSVFSLFSFLIVICMNVTLFRPRRILLAAFVVAAALLPWSAYQKFVDPPGNRLLKMHLAGIDAIDQRSFFEALRDSYRAHSKSEIVMFKWANLRMLIGKKPLDSFGLLTFVRANGKTARAKELEESRIAQREYIWNAIGLLNVGWISLLIFFLSARRVSMPVIPFGNWLIAAAIANLSVWCLVYFGPGGTFTTHSSYADILLLNIGLIGGILAWPSAVVLAILALQLFNLLAVWVLSPRSESIQMPFAVAALIFVSGSVVMFGWNTEPASGIRKQLRTLTNRIVRRDDKNAATSL